MRGTVDSIKERLDIVEVISSYLKLDKAGQNYKGKCPFHNEKTASFSVSQSRQGYYCFGCGAKGDIFSFVQELEGVDFKGALKMLADKAGVEIEYQKSGESKTEKDKFFKALDDAATFFENNLKENKDAHEYLKSRGINDESIKEWRLGYAPDEWRLLYVYLTSLGHSKDTLLKVGLIKQKEESIKEGEKEKEPYDVFRGRIIFPIGDSSGHIIAFSGRALASDLQPKYLNTPETLLFSKGEVLYGLDKAKDDIRKKNFAILVEGQMDLVLSHQAGIKNTVASSGTAFTLAHLDRLKRLSGRILLAFDGDTAGDKAAEKSSLLGLSLGMEVKVAKFPEGQDPADLACEAPDKLKDILREAKHAIEHTLSQILLKETDKRKIGKVIEKKLLPLLVLLSSSIERSHFVSIISKHTGIKEEVIWEDLRKTKAPDLLRQELANEENDNLIEVSEDSSPPSKRANIEKRLAEIESLKKEFPEEYENSKVIQKEESELKIRLNLANFEEERSLLQAKLQANDKDESVAKELHDLDRKVDEEKRKIM
ncbi:MAG: DNA primase [Parcubacteria bacterium C7867-005]|nr:MAG: DNA primase [Parcubacteria bacterium C7867-005]